MSSWKERLLRQRAMLTIVTGGFFLRLAWLIHARPEPVSDYQAYYLLAENLLDKRFLGLTESSAMFLPGYPSFLAALMLFSRSTDWLAFAMVILSTITIGFVFKLAYQLTGNQRVAIVASAASAACRS